MKNRALLMISAATICAATAAQGADRPVATPWGVAVDAASAPNADALHPYLLRQLLDMGRPVTTTAAATGGSAGGLQAAAQHIVDQQCINGGWGWPHDDCPTTYNNITAPIALGPLGVYKRIGHTPFLDSAIAGGDYDLTFEYPNTESRFSAGTAYFLWQLSLTTGDPTYADHAATGFYDELSGATYGPADLDTAGWVAAVEAARVAPWINLRPWEFSTQGVTAAAIGNAGQEAIFTTGVLDGLNTLDNTAPLVQYSDIIGLAGGIRGLALTGTTSFPAISAPSCAEIDGITDLCDLVDVLISYQNADGSWYWHSHLELVGGATEGDKDTQTTAYALLALHAAQVHCAPCTEQIRAGRSWVASMQDVDGGYFSYPGGDHNTEVEAEALDALATTGAGEMTLEIGDCPDDADPAAGYQVAVELWMRDLDTDATGFQAFLAFDDGTFTYRGDLSSYSGAPFSLHIEGISTALVAAGELRLDGSDVLGGAGTDADSLLATLIFDVDAGQSCTPVVVATFDLTQDFDSELSADGDPIATNLFDPTAATLDDTAPIISCPPDVAVQCIADADPGVTYGVSSGGIGVYYNDNGMGENPANQAYFKTQFDAATAGTGAPFVFDDTSLTGIPFSFQDLYSGLVWPDSQYGFDLVLPAATADGSVLPPALDAVDYDGVGASNPMPVLWAFDDYKPHAPDITFGTVFNSIVRSPSPGNPLTDVVVTRMDLSLSGTVYTMDVGGVLVSDGIHHWYTPAQPHSPMSNFSLNGLIYFRGTLTYDTTTDVDPLMDFYEGDVTFTANFPSAATGIATALDNCTLFPVIGYSDTDNGGSGCPGDPLVITRTWTATDDCGNESSCVQTITVLDDTDPTYLSVPDDIEVDAEAGGCTATFTAGEIGAPTATDNCNPIVAITFVRSDGALNIDDPYDAADSPITITWTATDDCDNTTDYAQTVTVNGVTEVTVTVELPGSVPTTRCIHFVTDDCTNVADVDIVFTDHDANTSTPVRGTATFEMGCGPWTFLCGKDEQHTKWETVGLDVVGDVFEADAILTLIAGDDDNDGDVDINDVTLIVATFGMVALDGDCPWDGTRDADFSNNGMVGTEDYSLITPEWLTMSSCGCTTLVDGGGRVWSIPVAELDPWVAARTDLDLNGTFDHVDVRIFEIRNGLPDTLSKAMTPAAARSNRRLK